MDDKEKAGITVNIYGGNNQFMPEATTATQNIYVGREAEAHPNEEKSGESLLAPEAAKLSIYINKVEDLNIYLAQIVACTSASELAQAIVNMAEREPKITPEEIVKERFISLFLPITPKITSGKSIDNIRARINDAWAKRPKKRL